LRVGDDLDPEDVGETVPAAVVSELPKDQVLAFLVEEKDPAEHFSRWGGQLIGWRCR